MIEYSTDNKGVKKPLYIIKIKSNIELISEYNINGIFKKPNIQNKCKICKVR